MFSKVVIDVSNGLSQREARLATIFDLIADESQRALLYFHADWRDKLVSGLPTEDFEPRVPRVMYMPCDASGNMLQHDGDAKRNLDLRQQTSELIVSSSWSVRKGVLEQQGLNANTSILVLAAAGIDCVLPNASFNQLAEEEIGKIKRELEDERADYLSAVASMADSAFARLKSGSWQDTLAWAQAEAQLKIVPKARTLENRLRRLDRGLLKGAGARFWKDGVPAIGSALFESGLKAAASSAAIEIVKTVSQSLSKAIEERRVPEATYLLKLSAHVPGGLG